MVGKACNGVGDIESAKDLFNTHGSVMILPLLRSQCQQQKNF